MRTKKQRQRNIYYFPKRLLARLAGIERYPLTIVEAPSGFGKTTAVQGYFDERPALTARIHWYTCLGEPPAKAWDSVCELFARVDGELAVNLKKLWPLTADTLANLALFMRRCSCKDETYLVIDNYQLVESDVPRDIINAFSAHSGKNLHIIFITQPLKGGREQTVHHANIHNIGVSDLTFDRESVAAYFEMSGIRLNDGELDSLHKSADGWVSAIRLQMVNYQRTGAFALTSDIEQLVQTAIWNGLDAEEKKALLSLCVLDGFTTRQAMIMLDKNALPTHILSLLGDGVFIRHDFEKDLYTMHSVLQDYLRGRFYNVQPDDFQTIVLTRAAKACESKADLYSAAQFYYKIRDFDSILSLSYSIAYLYNKREQYVTEFIVAIVEECPPDTLCRYPFVMLEFAFQLFLGGRREAFGKLFQMLSAVIAVPGGVPEEQLGAVKGEMALLTSFTEYNDVQKMSVWHREALALLGGPSKLFRPATTWTFGGVSVLYMFWNKSGELKNILDDMDECIPIYGKIANGHGAGANVVMRAEAFLLAGEDGEAETLCHKTLYIAGNQNQTGICICAALILGRIAILRGDADGCLTAVRAIQRYGLERPEPSIIRMSELGMAALNATLNNTDALTEGPADWLRDLDAIKRILFAPTVPYGHMLYGKYLLSLKRYNALYGLSEPMMDMAEGMRYLLAQVYHLLHLTAAKEAQGHTGDALEYLGRALAIALPDKIYLPFAEQGSSLLRLLELLKVGAKNRDGYDAIIAMIKRLKTGASAVRKAMAADKSPLTPREREVAALAKERLSAKEISELLFITESTVRSVLKTVYSKLDVHSKAELSKVEF